MDEKNLSMVELPQHFLRRLMLRVMSYALSSCSKSSLVY
jgi:hypothetical protein